MERTAFRMLALWWAPSGHLLETLSLWVCQYSLLKAPTKLLSRHETNRTFSITHALCVCPLARLLQGSHYVVAGSATLRQGDFLATDDF